MMYDALAMTYRTIDVRKDPQAAPITALADYGPPPGAQQEAAEEGPRKMRPSGSHRRNCATCWTRAPRGPHRRS